MALIGYFPAGGPEVNAQSLLSEASVTEESDVRACDSGTSPGSRGEDEMSEEKE